MLSAQQLEVQFRLQLFLSDRSNSPPTIDSQHRQVGEIFRSGAFWPDIFLRGIRSGTNPSRSTFLGIYGSVASKLSKSGLPSVSAVHPSIT